MKNVSQIVRVLAAVVIGATFISSLAHAQETNPNKLPRCPKPNYLIKTEDVNLYAGFKSPTIKWHNCWGEYIYQKNEYYKNTVRKGEWRNGVLDGYGTENSPGYGHFYEGGWKQGSFHGKGTMVRSGETYIGEWVDGSPRGNVIAKFDNGDEYKGRWKGYVDSDRFGKSGIYTYKNGTRIIAEKSSDNCSKCLFGKIIFINGDVYEGYISENSGLQMGGEGILTKANGEIYEGFWDQNKLMKSFKVGTRELQSTLIYDEKIRTINPNSLKICPQADNSKEELELSLDCKGCLLPTHKWNNCWGTYTWWSDASDKKITWVGEWKNGRLHGYGLENAGNDSYQGGWVQGKKHGAGKMNRNRHVYLGEWDAGAPSGNVVVNFINGHSYIGTWGSYFDANQAPSEGLGIYTYRDGTKVIGRWKFPKNYGEIQYTNGDIYQGEILELYPHGEGILTKQDGTRIEGIWEKNEFQRKSKINLSSSIVDEILAIKKIASAKRYLEKDENTENIDRERQQLAEERRRLEEDKRQREQQRHNERINMQVTHTQPNIDGSFTIIVQTNADTSSMRINGEEQGGRANGDYIVKKVARAGQETKFTIVATDINGITDTKSITVSRTIVDSKVTYPALNPGQVKQQTPRDAVAIIIGIADYKSLPKADFANDDARAFYDYAIRALGIKPENIKLLVDADAEEIEILRTFRNWLPSKVRSTTDVYVFYSGHGLPTADGQGLYLIPPRAAKDLIDDTAIPFSKINAALQSAKPKSVTMILDACYSGHSRSGETLVASARPAILKTENRLFPENFTVITASQNDQISSSNPDIQHGIFSYYLMKGMEGDADANRDGKITLGEMQAYLVENVGRQAGMMNRKQEPQLVGDANRVLVGR